MIRALPFLVAWLAALAAIGCGSVKNSPNDAPVVDDSNTDAPQDGAAVRCDPSKDFAAATLVPNLNSSNDEFAFALVRDESVGFLTQVVQPPNSNSTILTSQQVGGAFGAPSSTVTKPINATDGLEFGGSPTADGQILYFHRQDANAIGIIAAQQDNQGDYSAESQITVDGSGLTDALSATISADGQTLYWLDFVDFGKVFAATRGLTPSIFTNRRAASTMAIGSAPVLSADELTLFYAAGNGVDVLVSTRASTSAAFGIGVPVPTVNSNAEDAPVALSHDGCVLYISSARSGGLGGRDIWEARRPL